MLQERRRLDHQAVERTPPESGGIAGATPLPGLRLLRPVAASQGLYLIALAADGNPTAWNCANLAPKREAPSYCANPPPNPSRLSHPYRLNQVSAAVVAGGRPSLRVGGAHEDVAVPSPHPRPRLSCEQSHPCQHYHRFWMIHPSMSRPSHELQQCALRDVAHARHAPGPGWLRSGWQLLVNGTRLARSIHNAPRKKCDLSAPPGGLPPSLLLPPSLSSSRLTTRLRSCARWCVCSCSNAFEDEGHGRNRARRRATIPAPAQTSMTGTSVRCIRPISDGTTRGGPGLCSQLG